MGHLRCKDCHRPLYMKAGQDVLTAAPCTVCVSVAGALPHDFNDVDNVMIPMCQHGADTALGKCLKMATYHLQRVGSLCRKHWQRLASDEWERLKIREVL